MTSTSNTQAVPGVQAYRAQLLYFRDAQKAEDDACEWISDGLLVVRDGRIDQCGDYGRLAAELAPGTEVRDWRGHLIVPGFIDTHIHYPQTDMIASPAPG
ncbi:MAG TPA: guanine deaminase, partial [Castellaniella sp.]|nr:guanine deaminase [Castellaniella sp.]